MKQLGLFGGEPPFDSDVIENASELSKEAAQRQQEILEKNQSFKESSGKKLKIKKPNKRLADGPQKIGRQKIDSQKTNNQKTNSNQVSEPIAPNAALSGPEAVGQIIRNKKNTSAIDSSKNKPVNNELDQALFGKPSKSSQNSEAAPPKTTTPVARQQKTPLQVSDVNRHIKNLLEGQFSDIWIQGEVSNFKAHSSGHYYFSLKDDRAQISAVMFKGYNSKLRFKMEDGLEVIAKGKVTVYEPRGNYQIFCQSMEPVGAGALQLAFEQLKTKLSQEGLFAKENKKPLPAWPKHIALVTSPTGAAVKDMLKVLRRRYKDLLITVVPALVQGKGAPASIVKGLKQAQQLEGVDVVICGRGGGSMEDLWGFNDENVARTIASSKVPIISAVGHEVDFTIADFVADLRAPTPSAAAELVVKNTEDVLSHIKQLKMRSLQVMAKQIQLLKQTTRQYEARLVDPKRYLQDLAIRCDELVARLQRFMAGNIAAKKQTIELSKKSLVSPEAYLKEKKQVLNQRELQLRDKVSNLLKKNRYKLSESSKLLDSLSPLRVLDRGYSLVKTGSGQVVKSAESLSLGDKINIKFANGSADAVVDKVIKNEKS